MLAIKILLITSTAAFNASATIPAIGEIARRVAPAPIAPLKAVPAISVIVEIKPMIIAAFLQVRAILSRTCIAVPKRPVPNFASLSTGLAIVL